MGPRPVVFESENADPREAVSANVAARAGNRPGREAVPESV